MKVHRRAPRTPAEQFYDNRRGFVRLMLFGMLLFITYNVFYIIFYTDPRRFFTIEEEFKYGSIGSDLENGLPMRIMTVLPEAFARHLPPSPMKDYRAFGFIMETGHDLPIGFSQRNRLGGIPFTGLNCAICHTGAVTFNTGEPVAIHPGMPSNTVNLTRFFRFLFDCAADARFTPQDLIPYIEAERKLNPLERQLYPTLVRRMREGLLTRRDQLEFLFRSNHPAAGPGRVDTFNPYKAIQYRMRMSELPEKELVGTADFPSIWNQGPREGLPAHWDANSLGPVSERNHSASFGAGATPASVDTIAIENIRAWLERLPPLEYPYKSDFSEGEVAVGKKLYGQFCQQCHSDANFRKDDGTMVGQPTLIDEIRTDRYRLDSFTHQLAVHQATLVPNGDEKWRLKGFRKTNGYSNVPLDGIWARAPYLHNGSVPTLDDLLTSASARPKTFYRGGTRYDRAKLGFVSDRPIEDGIPLFRYDTRTTGTEFIAGNANTGHEYGTTLTASERRAMIGFLATF